MSKAAHGLLWFGSWRGGKSGPAAPVITSLSPSGCPTGGGATVSIIGTGLTGATVTFGGDAASSYGTQTDVLCEAVCPAHAEGLGDIVLTTPVGVVTLTDGFFYFAVQNGYDCLYNASYPTQVRDVFGSKHFTKRADGQFIDNTGAVLPGGVGTPYAFEGLGTNVSSSAAEVTPTATSQPVTIGGVFMTRAASGTVSSILSSWSTTGLGIWVNASGLIAQSWTEQLIGPRVDDTPFSCIVTFQGAGSLAWVNGVLASGWPKDTGTNGIPASAFYMGGYSIGGNEWKGLFYYWIELANALTTTTGPMVASWLAYAVKGRGVLL